MILKLIYLLIYFRFEQEILSQPSASDLPRVLIGPNTYNQVSAQLKMLRAQSGMSLEERERRQREVVNFLCSH